jgi:LysM repeat protein
MASTRNQTGHRIRYASAGILVTGTVAAGLVTQQLAAADPQHHDHKPTHTPQENHPDPQGTPLPDPILTAHPTTAKPQQTQERPNKAPAVGSLYKVRSGDTLAGIAAAQLGDSSRYPEIYDLNKDTAQPDGDRLTDPGAIQPGWELKLPAPGTPKPAHEPSIPTQVAQPVTTHTGSTQGGSPQTGISPDTVKVTPDIPVAPGSIQAEAESIVPSGQFGCFSEIISHESGWNPEATNPGSGAYGLGQALPGNKMASEGADWQTNPVTQLKWALGYMDSRYGSPCDAWNFWQDHSWY